MSSWLDALNSGMLEEVQASRHKGERAALDLNALGGPPATYFEREPVMGVKLYDKTIIVSAYPLEADLMVDDHDSGSVSSGSQAGSAHSLFDASGNAIDKAKLMDLVMAGSRRRLSSATAMSRADSHDESKGSDGRSSVARSLARSHTSSASGRSLRSTPSFFVESSEVASLASKYSMLHKRKKKTVHKILVAEKLQDARAAASTGASSVAAPSVTYTASLARRREAVEAIRGIVHGLAEVREFWEHEFCYLRFHTVDEAKFAQRHIHKAIAAEGIIADVVRNCFRI